MPLICQQLLRQYPEQWQTAIKHPFLEQCQKGTILPHQFNTWLVQDYHFVVEFTRLAASLLQAAPVEHFDLILGGITVLKEELAWFHAKAKDRNLDLNQPLQQTCQTYCKFMQDLAQQSYPVQATGFWAIELAYNQGWQSHSPMPEPYTEFADRWGNAAFTAYVQQLEQQANSVLATADNNTQTEAEKAFITVANLEKEFWQMAYEGQSL
ncbi:MAG: TenA family transcriptional regulator [Cyanobacteria bacterium P01_D01_bin.156]